jgi:hypothetical protein
LFAVNASVAGHRHARIAFGTVVPPFKCPAHPLP